MINFIENSLFFWAALSLAGYEVGLLLKKKFKMALFNPLLIAILCVMGMLQLMQVDYKTYMQAVSISVICLLLLQYVLRYRFTDSLLCFVRI